MVIDAERKPLQHGAVRIELRRCIENGSGIYAVIISSVDGNSVIEEHSQPLPSERLATMNSSMLALAETMARESRQRLCRFVILENSDGRIVSLRINETLLLTCVANQDSNLGMVLRTGQTAAQSLTRLLQSECE